MTKYLSVISLVFLLCFVIGCQDKAAMAELEQFKAQTETEGKNKALVERLMGELSKGNADILYELYAPDYAWYYPSSSNIPMSREVIKQTIEDVYKAFPDITWNIEELIAVEDKVINRFVLKGTQEGEFRGIPATGNKIEVSAILITRIENGKIVEDRENSDLLGWMQQLGMELKPKEAGK